MLREGQVRIPSGCAISGIMNKRGEVFSGQDIIKSIALMHDRSNGLGGGFAAYGIYPDFPEHYAFHLYYEEQAAKEKTEQRLNSLFHVAESGKIPTRRVGSIHQAPLAWRYFVRPKPESLLEDESEDELVVRTVMHINSQIKGAFVVSSGKNMGAFKGVGFPEDMGEYFRLEEYKGNIWLAHGRFPTNTPGWWGGAHPFTLLDWSIVHNGEISSYGANKRYLEMFGYRLTMQTDTEAITYAFDLLVRKHNVPLDIAIATLAAPFWRDIERMDPERQKLFKTVRAVYGSLLLNGPFSIILGSNQGIVALNDRLKLRSLVAASQGDFLYVASEESAIREICPSPERVWAPRGGEPVIGLFEEGGNLV
ncbi:Glutamate synthase large subunit domain 1 stand-alone protein [Acididesulfobacillus acetoxydans]|uniref:Glutamate synthase large subunit domain 1 stand-alone protein n=1 Tax=Acididesulfobacillus acetoxydans TaxID=1561005 RepID=A0A8S0XVY5_9FIRM|nr:glutamine amidotransferase family protein [Acididesulfobacillus acetoxydans]CAA7600687.1 Glutamate synthase large subunit domain 1 stand-alone protein [Acididesulfobacillus acetoxydans]CEJ09468.1 Glutamine amidotransferase [Acididesulfobacillus acetoxydans]